jgi:shikimate dehydrogenase
MTTRACVIGWPISHSRSPLIHGYWLKRYGIDGSYGIEAVKPENVASFLRDLGDGRYVGCNVTIPHKEAAFAAVRAADAATQRLGAVNTVFRRDGAILGTNTDGEGFVASVTAHIPAWNAAGKRAVVLGAGGAARAIVGALVDSGIESVTIVNRSEERARLLCQLFGGPLRACGWSGVETALQDVDILINTTSLGMKWQPPLDISLDALPRTAVVADIVYVPLETELIRTARVRGNPAVPGLGMLLNQAVRGFELWFGVRPEVTSELHDLITADIERAQ